MRMQDILQHRHATQHSCSFSTIPPLVLLFLPYFFSLSPLLINCIKFDTPWEPVVKHLTSYPSSFPLPRDLTWSQYKDATDPMKLQWKRIELISLWYRCSHILHLKKSIVYFLPPLVLHLFWIFVFLYILCMCRTDSRNEKLLSFITQVHNRSKNNFHCFLPLLTWGACLYHPLFPPSRQIFFHGHPVLCPLCVFLGSRHW